MVENLNSRLRPYLNEKKSFNKNRLSLIQFYLNHKQFLRSKFEEFKGKTPAEILTNKTHKDWLELLGFNSFKRNAA